MQQPGELGAVVGVVYIGIVFGVTGAQPKTYEVVEHQNLLVICNATSDPSTIIYWTKNDTRSTFFQNGTKLELIDVTRREAGDYVCHVLNTSSEADNGTEWNRTVQVVKVDVLYPAEFRTCSIQPTTILAKGTYSIYFDVVGNPEPRWEIRNNRTMAVILKAGLPMSGNQNVLPRCGDDGFMECTGFNYLNNGVNSTGGAYVTILCGPKPNPDVQMQYTVESYLNVEANLTMRFVGNPTPTPVWIRDDDKPIPWTRVTQVDTNSSTMLKFTNVQVSDFTDYTLLMKNKYSIHMSHFKLNPTGPPQRPTNLGFANVTYDSVTLHWTSGFDMGSVQFYKVYNYVRDHFNPVSDEIYDRSTTHGIGQNVTYVLTGLQSDTFYNLTVQAISSVTLYRSGYVHTPVMFTTLSRPDSPDRYKSTYVAVGTSLGILGLVAVMAFVVYFLKFRKMRTAYTKT